MEDEVLDFFKPVASDILKKLKAKPCVPTQPNEQGREIFCLCIKIFFLFYHFQIHVGDLGRLMGEPGLIICFVCLLHYFKTPVEDLGRFLVRTGIYDIC